MRIGLINAPIKFNTNLRDNGALGILYLAAVLLKSGHDVWVRDYSAEEYDARELSRLLNESDTECVGISCLSASYNNAKTIIHDIHTVSGKDPVILLGGNHPTAMPEQTIEELGDVIVVRGEGEAVVDNLISCLENNGQKGLESVDGISYRSTGTIVHKPDAELIRDIDSLPFPARELLSINNTGRPDLLSNIVTSRGCPYSCVFCEKGITRRKVRFRSPENVVSEIESIFEAYGKRRIFFVDDTLTLDQRRAEKLLDLIDERNLKFDWTCLSRVDSVSQHLLSRMKKSGCTRITFGIETGDRKMLELIQKGTTLEQAERAVKSCRAVDLDVKANLIFGLPWETKKSAMRTMKFAGRLPVRGQYDFFIATPYPGTRLWDIAKEGGFIEEPFDWSKFTQFDVFFTLPDLSKEDLISFFLYSFIYVFRKRFFDEIRPWQLPGVLKDIMKKGVRKTLLERSLTLYAAYFRGAEELTRYGLVNNRRDVATLFMFPRSFLKHKLRRAQQTETCLNSKEE